MSPQHPIVRVATMDDVEGAVDTLVRSHLESPWDRWVLPDDDPEDHLRAQVSAWMSRLAIPLGQTWITDDSSSVAVWIHPDAPGPDRDVVAALDAVTAEVLGPRAAVVATAEARIHAARPPGRHHVLATLGTRPGCRGRGLATAVLAPVLDQLDQASESAVLDTSSEANVRWYRRRGFEVVTCLDDLPDRCPPTWIMHRDPAGARPGSTPPSVPRR